MSNENDSSQTDRSITGVLDAWENEVEDGKSNVGSILRATGSRAAGPLLFLPALVMVSPVGAIPGVPIVLSTLIVLVAGQIVIGRESLWLPDFLRKREIPEDKVTSVIDTLRPYAKKTDKILGRRLTWLTGGAVPRVIAAICILLSILVYPATLVPLAVALPGAAIILLSLGLLTRDGVVVLLGLLLSAAAAAALLYWFL